MAKKKVAEGEDNIFDGEIDFGDLAKALDCEVLHDMEPVKCWIDTGNLALNYICSERFINGGIPSGKIIEIFGNSATCKSLFGTNILSGVQRRNGIAVLIDAENSVNKDFAQKASSLDPKRTLIIQAEFLEDGFEKMKAVIKLVREVKKVPMDRPIVIVYDSIAASPSKREHIESSLDKTISKAARKEAGGGTEQPGERARTCSREFRTLTSLLNKNNASAVFINQIRQKIGVMFGPDETTAGGGRALEYYASLRIRTKGSKRFADDVDNIIGIKISASTEKNRHAAPFKTAKDMQLFFAKGINPVGGLLEIMVQSGRVSGGNGSYQVNEPWANGEIIKFKASKDRNDIPAKALISCPALIDAENAEQVESYLSRFQDAINTAENGIAKEEDLGDE